MSSPFTPSELGLNKCNNKSEPETIKSRLRSRIRKQQRDITEILREANDKADTLPEKKRSSPTFNKKLELKK